MASARRAGSAWFGGLALALLALWGLAAAAGAISPAAREAMLRKEGVLEHVTHAVLLGALIGHALLARRIGRRHALLALVCGFYLAEELDWGQVYLGFATPSWLLPLTGRSDACNIHNTAAADGLLMAAACGYLVVLPGLGRLGRAPAWTGRLGLGPARLAYAGLFFAILVAAFAVERLPRPPFDADEMMDLSVALLLAHLAAAHRVAFAGDGEG